MTKQTFFGLLFMGIFIAVYAFPSDYEIKKAEAESIQTMYEDDTDHYELHIIEDSLILTDPNTGKEIYRESIDSKSILSEAILKDNE